MGQLLLYRLSALRWCCEVWFFTTNSLSLSLSNISPRMLSFRAIQLLWFRQHSFTLKILDLISKALMSSSLSTSDDASNTHSEDKPCAVCKEHKPIYTCPRCSLKTCSLQCVKAHKQAFSCSGIRDRAAYVPMNQYGWGKMMDDYTYLEDVGRQVEGWGREIVQHGLINQQTTQTRGGIRGRGRGRGQGRTKNVMRSNKREYLSLQLGFHDIDMDVLPVGMSRHKLNQSRWDNK